VHNKVCKVTLYAITVTHRSSRCQSTLREGPQPKLLAAVRQTKLLPAQLLLLCCHCSAQVLLQLPACRGSREHGVHDRQAAYDRNEENTCCIWQWSCCMLERFAAAAM
jgi:hypothetical protein